MKKLCYLLLLGFGLVTTSCQEDFLDKQPLDALSNETYWTTSDEAVQAVNACYRFLSDSDQRIFLSCATDDSYSWSNWPSDIQFIGNGSATTNVGVFGHFWSFFYQAIARANTVVQNIDRVPNMDAALKARLTAEARFIRAYAYQQLIGLYGDVPLITQLQSTSEFNVPRTPRAEVAAFVAAEMDAIDEALPLSYPATDGGRITRGAALTLKARTMLYEGKWAEAATAAKAVMDLGQYALDNNYVSLFDGTNKTSKEIILADQHIKNLYATALATWVGGPTLGGWGQVVPLQSLVDAYETIDGQPITASTAYDPAKPFENRDPRLKMTILTPGSVINGKTIDVTAPGSLDAPGKNNASYSGYYYRKYIPNVIEGNWDSNSWNDFVLMRYAEVLLIYAEAQIEAGAIDQSVYDAINAVRNRPGVNMPAIPTGKSQAQLRDIVRHERRVEFPLEEHRLFDIRRWKIAEQVLNADAKGILSNWDPSRGDYGKNIQIEKRTFRPERDYLWAIPQTEIDVNRSLQQNPNW